MSQKFAGIGTPRKHFNRDGSGESIAEVLNHAVRRLSSREVKCARLDAELLLMAVLGWPRERLYRNLQCELADEQRAALEDLLSRRTRGEPVAYITGSREFWSLDFNVCRDVLVPRPETEHLVEAVLDFLSSWRGPLRILELGTGSGAVAISLAHERRDIEVWATDVSRAALRVAQHNAQRHGVSERIHFREGDLFAALGPTEEAFAAILSNPPYIASGEIADLPLDVRDWEPHLALDGGIDGLVFHRRIISEGKRYLLPAGLLALEIGSLTAASVCELFHASTSFRRPAVVRDYSGCDRVVGALRTVC